jgi:hypothetical protein
MIHQFIFAGPKPGLSADAFTSYWINLHAVDYAAKIKQIRQYLVAARLPVATGRDVPSDLQGVAEIWLKDDADQIASLQSPEFLQGARLDEPRWAAFWLTLVLNTESQVLTQYQGTSPDPEFIKLYVLLKRKPDLALADFRRKLIADRGDLGKRYPLARHLVGLCRDALYGLGEPAFDAVELIALPDIAALEALLADKSFATALTKRAYVHDAYAFNFVAREHWIIRPGER